MSTVSVADAWSLAPIGELRLGDRVVPVPPLTFGRFQRLIASEPEKILTALVVAGAPHKRTLAERVVTAALRWSVIKAPAVSRYLWRLVDALGLGIRHVRIPDAAKWAALCVPTITEAEWRAHGTQRLFAQAFLMFGRSHDWAFIADAIRFGEPPEPGESMPSRVQMVGGLLAIAKATGYTVEALNEMRVEGFYLLVESLRSDREPSEQPIPLGLDYVEGEDGANLLEMLHRAEEAGRG